MNILFRCQFCDALMEFHLETDGERGQCKSCGHDLVYPFFFTAGFSGNKKRTSWLIRFLALFNLRFSRKIQGFFRRRRAVKQQAEHCRKRLNKSDLQALQFIETAIKRDTQNEH